MRFDLHLGGKEQLRVIGRQGGRAVRDTLYPAFALDLLINVG
jgi:hypothetical protein